MSKVGSKLKELFTALGEVGIVQGRKRFCPNSVDYINDNISRLPVGRKLACTFYDKIPSRSQAQLAYHMILMKYLAEYSGTTREEMHDAVMRLKFGTKKVILMGLETHVRKSLSDAARFPKAEMVELIDYDLKLCAWANIKVPTREELGYLPN